VGKLKLHGAFHGLTGYAVGFTPASKIATGFKHVGFSATVGGNVIGTSWHLSFLLLNSQHPHNSFLVRFPDDSAGAKIAFQFGGFFGFNMCAFGVMTHNFATTGYLKSFGGRSVSFDLRHFYLLVN